MRIHESNDNDFWDTTALFNTVKVHQKVRNFATKKTNWPKFCVLCTKKGTSLKKKVQDHGLWWLWELSAMDPNGFEWVWCNSPERVDEGSVARGNSSSVVVECRPIGIKACLHNYSLVREDEHDGDDGNRDDEGGDDGDRDDEGGDDGDRDDEGGDDGDVFFHHLASARPDDGGEVWGAKESVLGGAHPRLVLPALLAVMMMEMIIMKMKSIMMTLMLMVNMMTTTLKKFSTQSPHQRLCLQRQVHIQSRSVNSINRI